MVDVKELEALLQRLEDVGKREEACVKATKEVAGRFLERVDKATPVGEYPSGSGKTGGTLRAGWVGATKEDPKPKGKPYPYGKKQPVSKSGDTYTVDLENKVEYASYVELGHRIIRNKKQIGVVPPKYFVKKTEEAFAPEANGWVKKVLEKYLKGVLDGK